MTLKLASSDKDLDMTLRVADADGAMSPVEFQGLRDQADIHASKVDLASVREFMAAADKLVELMQHIALEARKAKLPDTTRAAIRDAAEYQVAYVVAGHKSSTERL